MRRSTSFILTFVMALMLATASVSADSPHFIKTGATGPNASGDLVVNFKIAGLGDNETLNITVGAQATAVYACQNGGGNFPADPKKQEVSGPVTASGDFESGKNGQITGSLTLSPPVSTLDCPNGQHEVLASVSYTGVYVSAAGVGLEAVLGTFSRVFYVL